MVWKALGGKSGSSFTKSADGRFVLKQMSRLELQSFVDFAPHYFAYITQAIEEKVRSVIPACTACSEYIFQYTENDGVGQDSRGIPCGLPQFANRRCGQAEPASDGKPLLWP